MGSEFQPFFCGLGYRSFSQTDVQPYLVEQLNIAVAQRYSVLVTARNDTSSNWAIHANMDADMVCHTPPASLEGHVLSVA